MRVLWPALALTVAACAPTAGVATTSTPPATGALTTLTATTTTQTIPEPELTLMLSEEEAPAVDREIRLEVSNESGEVLGWMTGTIQDSRWTPRHGG